MRTMPIMPKVVDGYESTDSNSFDMYSCEQTALYFKEQTLETDLDLSCALSLSTTTATRFVSPFKKSPF